MLIFTLETVIGVVFSATTIYTVQNCKRRPFSSFSFNIILIIFPLKFCVTKGHIVQILAGDFVATVSYLKFNRMQFSAEKKGDAWCVEIHHFLAHIAPINRYSSNEAECPENALQKGFTIELSSIHLKQLFLRSQSYGWAASIHSCQAMKYMK